MVLLKISYYPLASAEEKKKLTETNFSQGLTRSPAANISRHSYLNFTMHLPLKSFHCSSWFGSMWIVPSLTKDRLQNII